MCFGCIEDCLLRGFEWSGVMRLKMRGATWVGSGVLRGVAIRLVSGDGGRRVVVGGERRRRG